MHDLLFPAPESKHTQGDFEFARSFRGPISFDLLVTTRCQLRCPSCFASPDQIPEISTDQWLNLIYLSYLMKTRSLIFTGGEPLLLDSLPDLLKYAKQLGLTTTLSTNAILLMQKRLDVLPFLDEIGIPLDGHDAATNSLMRMPNGHLQFQIALEAMKFILARYPSIELTMRTVVTSLNIETVLRIPDTLEGHGIDTQRLRWKLYQFNPIGDHFTMTDIRRLAISTADFLSIWAELRNTSYWFECYPAAVQDGTYAIILPNGELVTTVLDTSRPNPYDFPFFRYSHLGNLITDFRQSMERWHQQKYTEVQQAWRWPPKTNRQTVGILQI